MHQYYYLIFSIILTSNMISIGGAPYPKNHYIFCLKPNFNCWSIERILIQKLAMDGLNLPIIAWKMLSLPLPHFTVIKIQLPFYLVYKSTKDINQFLFSTFCFPDSFLIISKSFATYGCCHPCLTLIRHLIFQLQYLYVIILSFQYLIIEQSFVAGNNQLSTNS